MIGDARVEDGELAESLRQRDLLVQIERFLKYAPKGTDPAVLRDEARAWSQRLDALASGPHASKAKALQAKLARLHG